MFTSKLYDWVSVFEETEPKHRKSKHNNKERISTFGCEYTF